MLKTLKENRGGIILAVWVLSVLAGAYVLRANIVAVVALIASAAACFISGLLMAYYRNKLTEDLTRLEQLKEEIDVAFARQGHAKTCTCLNCNLLRSGLTQPKKEFRS